MTTNPENAAAMDPPTTSSSSLVPFWSAIRGKRLECRAESECSIAHTTIRHFTVVLHMKFPYTLFSHTSDAYSIERKMTGFCS